MMIMKNCNEQRWLNLWDRIDAKGDARKIYNNLVALYSESHRAYHTLVHIEHCLGELEQIRKFITVPDVVELALWYHDAVYDTNANDNEEKSAVLAVGVIRDASLPKSYDRLIADLIMATKHVVIPSDLDAQLLVDIDLSIFGQPESAFNEYERQIRKEFGWISDNLFNVKRLELMKSFLDRPTIYATQFFRCKYEVQARKNIARSIIQLQDALL